MTTRRHFLAAGTAPFWIAGAVPNARAALQRDPNRADVLPPPKYTLAVNLELMFPKTTSYEERLAAVAKVGAKHYGFWNHKTKDLDALLSVQDRHRMTCVSLIGSPVTGWKSGLTRPGEQQAFLDDVAASCKVANRFGAENLITFVGAVQPDVPWEMQRAQIIAGLKKAGDIAREHKVFLTLEPLNRVESPQMSMLTSREAFDFASECDHPNVKVDYDMYHRQLGEGNVSTMLEEGLTKGLIRFVEIGDVPGRKEVGSGEMNHAFLFRRLRSLGYAGYVGMEHGTTRDLRHAWNVTRKIAGL